MTSTPALVSDPLLLFLTPCSCFWPLLFCLIPCSNLWPLLIFLTPCSCFWPLALFLTPCSFSVPRYVVIAFLDHCKHLALHAGSSRPCSPSIPAHLSVTWRPGTLAAQTRYGLFVTCSTAGDTLIVVGYTGHPGDVSEQHYGDVIMSAMAFQITSVSIAGAMVTNFRSFIYTWLALKRLRMILWPKQRIHFDAYLMAYTLQQ